MKYSVWLAAGVIAACQSNPDVAQFRVQLPQEAIALPYAEARIDARCGDGEIVSSLGERFDSDDSSVVFHTPLRCADAHLTLSWYTVDPDGGAPVLALLGSVDASLQALIVQLVFRCAPWGELRLEGSGEAQCTVSRTDGGMDPITVPGDATLPLPRADYGVFCDDASTASVSTTFGTRTTVKPTLGSGVAGSTRLAQLSSTSGAIAFDPAVTSYALALPYLQTLDLSAVAEDPLASIAIDGGAAQVGRVHESLPIESADFLVSIVVTGADGVTTQTYTLHVTVEAPDTDVALAMLSADSGFSPSFDPETLSYVAPATMASSLHITAATRSALAVLTLNGQPVSGTTVDTDVALINGQNTITLRVTAQSGATRDYTVSVFCDAPSVRLASLAVQGATLTFDPNVTSVDVTVPYGATSATVTATSEQQIATVAIDGQPAEVGTSTRIVTIVSVPSLITVHVQSSDNQTRDYTLTVDWGPPSSDASLSSLTAGVSFTPTFDPATLAYDGTVTAATNVSVTAVANGPGATVNIAGLGAQAVSSTRTLPLSPGQNTIDIVVTSQASTTQTYTLSVPRNNGSPADASLSAIVLSPGGLSTTFNAGTFAYDVWLAGERRSVNITPTLSNPAATITISGVSSPNATAFRALTPGATTSVSIVVTAFDGVTTNTYTLTLRRGLITALTTTPATLDTFATEAPSSAIHMNCPGSVNVSTLALADPSIAPKLNGQVWPGASPVVIGTTVPQINVVDVSATAPGAGGDVEHHYMSVVCKSPASRLLAVTSLPFYSTHAITPSGPETLGAELSALSSPYGVFPYIAPVDSAISPSLAISGSFRLLAPFTNLVAGQMTSVDISVPGYVPATGTSTYSGVSSALGGIVMDRTGLFAYWSGDGLYSVVGGAMYGADVTSGGIGSNPGATAIGFQANSLVMHPVNGHLFASGGAKVGVVGVAGKAVSSTSFLTATQGAISSVAADPTGRRVYAVHPNGQITRFAFDRAFGTLSEVASDAVALSSPTRLVFHPNGQLAWQGGVSGDVRTFAVDQVTGALSLVGTVTVGAATIVDVQLDPDAQRVYMLGNAQIYQASVAGDGQPTGVGAPVATRGGAFKLQILDN